MGSARIEEVADGRHSNALEACDEVAKSMRLMLDARGNLKAFLPARCPDCEVAA